MQKLKSHLYQLNMCVLEKAMAPHSNTLAWKIPWMEEPGTVHGVSKSWTQLKLLRNLYAGQETTVRTGHGTTDGSKQEKEYVKFINYHCAYLTYMQNIS